MRISIAMATYNGEKYLQEQLDSLLNQTRLPDEIIISDDCSKDRTVEILERFAEIAEFDVKIYKNEVNLGCSGNFNRAMSYTTGDLVFLCDQDDVWFPNKIEYIVGLAIQDPYSLAIMNDAVLTNASLVSTGLTKLGQMKSAGMPSTEFVMGCCSAIRRELLDICLPIPGDYQSHDTWIMLFADALRRKKISNQVLQYFRRHGANESNSIASRLSKVGRLSLLIHNIKSDVVILFTNTTDNVETERRHKDSIQKVLDNYLQDQRVNNVSGIERFMRQNYIEKKQLDARLEVRRGRLFVRIFRSAQLWMRGGYKESLGFKGVIRDVLLM